MLPIILKIELMTTAMAGWTAAASPVPLPAEAVATLFAGHATVAPVPVDLYDENDHQKGAVAIWRDGSTDEATTTEIKHLFRCRKTHREQHDRAADARDARRRRERYRRQDDRVRLRRTASAATKSATSPHRHGIARSTSASAASQLRDDSRLPVADVHATSASAGTPRASTSTSTRAPS